MNSMNLSSPHNPSILNPHYSSLSLDYRLPTIDSRPSFELNELYEPNELLFHMSPITLHRFNSIISMNWVNPTNPIDIDSTNSMNSTDPTNRASFVTHYEPFSTCHSPQKTNLPFSRALFPGYQTATSVCLGNSLSETRLYLPATFHKNAPITPL